MDIQKARQLHALRGIQPTVIRLPPMYGAPFSLSPQFEDVTFRGDEPQTWAQTMKVDPLNTVLPYVNPMFDQLVEDAEERYGDTNQQLDDALSDQLPNGPMGLFQPPQQGRQEGDIQGSEGSDTLAGGTRSRYTLTPQDVQAVNNTASRLGVRPADLMAVIHYETIGTMNPTIKGGKGGNYQGLIQFGPRERRTYGYDKDASFAEQIEGPVYAYLKGRGLPYGASLGTIYRTVNGGNPNANLRFKDGPIVNGRRTGRTIAQHIQAITANNLPQAEMLIANVGPLGPNAEAIASLQAPEGGTEVSSPPSPLQGYVPNIPEASFDTPAQAAIADQFGQPGDLTADQIDELTRTDVAGNYTNPLVAPPSAPSRDFDFAAGPGPTFTPPPISRSPGPGGALGVDLGMEPAGMPVPPSRPGTFDWLGGGAPDAGLVPTPGISPLRPAMGGPGDRRPQPPNPAPRPWQGPMPQGRPGNFDWTGGGAPGAPPDPRMRPSGPQSPVEAFSAPAGPLDLIPYSTQPGATPAPPIPGPDRSILAGGNFGTPETAMSLERTFPPPSPLAGIDQRMDRAFSEAQSRGLARELGFNRRQMEGFTPPPRSFDIATGPSPPEHRSGEWFTPAPPMPAPLAEARMKDDVFSPSSGPYFSNADPGPTFTPPSDLPGRFEDAFAPGPTFTPPPPAPSAPMAYSELSPISGGAGADALNPLAPPPPPSISMADFGGRFDPAPPPISRADFNERWGPTQETPPTPVLGDPGVSLPMTEPVADEPLVASPNPIDIAIGDAGLGTARQLRRTDPNRPSLIARIGNALVPGSPFGPGGGGVGGFGFGIGPGGFFSNAGSFTPSGAGGTSFFNQQPNGQMGTTNWRQGSVTGNPNMSGVMWNRSGDNGSVGFVTDPFNPGTSMIYSGSPNRF